VAAVDRFLPAASRSAIPAPREVQPAERRLPVPIGKTVLAIDDVQLNLDLLRETLESVGYRVLEAHDLKGALQHVEQTRPDIVLCDVHMPGNDGYAVLRLFKDHPKGRDIPFVFMSSSGWNVQARKRGLQMGAVDFVMRPINPPDLVKILDRVLK
jgi:CheY-like chemotaxis protein